MDNISPELRAQLEIYSQTITKWNKAYNLLSASQEDLWNRHILDSLQIFDDIKEGKIIIDFGSGAGFPAIVCAIVSKLQNIQQQYILIESVNKKAQFLEEAARVLGLKNVKVICDRIENISDIKADIITARAFAKIDEIFDYAKNITSPNAKYILLKGKNLEAEILDAQKRYQFKYTSKPSITGDGFVFFADKVHAIPLL